MVFRILLWYGSKVIWRIGINLSSLGPINLICLKFYLVSLKAQFFDLFSLLPVFTLMIFLMSLVSLKSTFRSHNDAKHLVSIVNIELAKIIILLKVKKL